MKLLGIIAVVVLAVVLALASVYCLPEPVERETPEGTPVGVGYG